MKQFIVSSIVIFCIEHPVGNMCDTTLIKAKRAMALGQYTRAIKYFKAYMHDEPQAPLNEEELTVLSEACKNVLDKKRYNMWKQKAYIESLEVKDEEFMMSVSLMFDKSRNDMIAFCADVIDVINGNLILNCVETRESVLIYMMKGDYYR